MILRIRGTPTTDALEERRRSRARELDASFDQIRLDRDVLLEQANAAEGPEERIRWIVATIEAAGRAQRTAVRRAFGVENGFLTEEEDS